MFFPSDILYEDNHILIVNKKCGQLVQPDTGGTHSLEDDIKAFIKKRDHKPGNVFLGVVHRIDRPVSGAVLFAKSAKALRRLNEMVRDRKITKTYWAVVGELPRTESARLEHYILRDNRTNKAKALSKPQADAKLAVLEYEHIASSSNYHLLAVNLITGRHHQIRAQLSRIGSPIKGDLKYGSPRSNPDGGISLHSRQIEFEHPVTHEAVRIVAPVPADSLWDFFEHSI